MNSVFQLFECIYTLFIIAYRRKKTNCYCCLSYQFINFQFIKRSLMIILTIKRLGAIWLVPCDFTENLSSKERFKPLLFETFNIIISHIFPEKALKFLKLFKSYVLHEVNAQLLCNHFTRILVLCRGTCIKEHTIFHVFFVKF